MVLLTECSGVSAIRGLLKGLWNTLYSSVTNSALLARKYKCTRTGSIRDLRCISSLLLRTSMAA